MRNINILNRFILAATMLAGTAACAAPPSRTDTIFNLAITNGSCSNIGQKIDSTVNGVLPGNEVQLNYLTLRYNGKDKKLDVATPTRSSFAFTDIRNDGDRVTFSTSGTVNTATLRFGDRVDLQLEAVCIAP